MDGHSGMYFVILMEQPLSDHLMDKRLKTILMPWAPKLCIMQYAATVIAFLVLNMDKLFHFHLRAPLNEACLVQPLTLQYLPLSSSTNAIWFQVNWINHYSIRQNDLRCLDVHNNRICARWIWESRMSFDSCSGKSVSQLPGMLKQAGGSRRQMGAALNEDIMLCVLNIKF